MLIDTRGEFSVDQDITSGGASTNIVDLGVALRHIGPGRPLWVVAVLREALAGDTETLSIQLQTSAAENFSPAVTIATSRVLTDDDPVGTRVVIGVPNENQRFLRLNYVDGTLSAGKVSAWLTDQDPTTWTAYPGQT